MRSISHAAWLGTVFAGTLCARPVTLGPVTSFATPDPTYTGFATDVAIDGDYALVIAGRDVPDPGGEPLLDQHFVTAFLFKRNGTSWSVVRRLNEFRQDDFFPIPPAVAMRDGLAAVQTVETEIWELGASGWVQRPGDFTRDGPGPHL